MLVHRRHQVGVVGPVSRELLFPSQPGIERSVPIFEPISLAGMMLGEESEGFFDVDAELDRQRPVTPVWLETFGQRRRLPIYVGHGKPAASCHRDAAFL